MAWRVVRCFAGEVLAQHVRERAVVNTWVSQVLDVTKAAHCTGSVSSALASGDAGERITAAPTRTSGK